MKAVISAILKHHIYQREQDEKCCCCPNGRHVSFKSLNVKKFNIQGDHLLAEELLGLSVMSMDVIDLVKVVGFMGAKEGDEITITIERNRDAG